MAKNILGIDNVTIGGTYLGLPSVIGRSKNQVFGFIKDKILKRIQGWNSKLLTQAGKETLIKSVLQAIPTYIMSVFLLPNSLCTEIERMMNSFWWGWKKNSEKGIRWMRWSKLTVAKHNGGIGFRDLQAFNLALLAKHGWRFRVKPNSLAARVFIGKYFPNSDLLEANLGNNPSYVWRSLWKSLPLLKQGCAWRVGDGSKINVWSHDWLLACDGYRLTTNIRPGFEETRVKDLITEDGFTWNENLLETLFNDSDVNAIKRLKLNTTCLSDIVYWKNSRLGNYDVKSAYHLSRSLLAINPSNSMNRIWSLVWNLKLPPRMKNFIWRVLTCCLPTRKNLVEKGIISDNVCPLCNGEEESEDHLFLKCHFAQSCWRESNLEFSIEHSDNFNSWFGKLCQDVNKAYLAAVISLLCSLWKGRNMLLWNNRYPNPFSTVRIAKDSLAEWNEVNDNSSRSSISTETRWRRPPLNILKANVDGAIFAECNRYGVGLIVRDWDGKFIFAKAQSFDGCFDPSTVEVLAIRHACTWLQELGYSNILIESDCAIAVSSINSDTLMYRSPLGGLMQDCASLLSQLHFSLSWVRRNANMAAHVLARSSLSLIASFSWGIAPAFLTDVLNSDNY